MIPEFLNALIHSGFKGEVRTDWATRVVFSTDNSIYEWMPDALVFPKHHDDLVALGTLLRRPEWRSITISPRGGGTGTNAQSLNRGIIVDTSRYMNHILAIDPVEKTVTVQPGVVLDALNHELSPFGLRVGPCVAPGNRATIGGMVSTDASGEGSRFFGKTSESILEITGVSVHGESLHFDRRHSGQLGPLLDDIRSSHRPEIEARFPKISRFMTGYNLDHATRNALDAIPIIAGSEGTLMIITSVKMTVVPIPKTTLFVVQYPTLIDAIDGALELVTPTTIAVETLDRMVIDAAQNDPIYALLSPWIHPEMGGINLVEIEQSATINPTHPCILSVEQCGSQSVASSWWQLRKKAVGLLGNLPGTAKPVPFVEDCVVPPHHMSDFIREFKAVLDRHGLHYAMYGHADVGCVHVRPALDLQNPDHAQLIRPISDEVYTLTRKYGGIIWGEHGKGIRGIYTAEIFGDTLYKKMREIKTLFDPYNQLNPGKIVTPIESEAVLYPIESPLRADGDKTIPKAVQSQMQEVMNCNGNGACFNALPHALMCPSYRATGDRVQSPKGRAMIVKEWIRSNRSNAHLDDIKLAMDSCLSCKACTSECPVHVDIPDIRSQFLEHYYQCRPRPLRDWLVAKMEQINPLIDRFRITRWIANTVPLRWAGLCDLPPYQSRSSIASPSTHNHHRTDTVTIAIDPYNGYFDTAVVNAATKVLDAMDFNVAHYYVPATGKPALVKGFRQQFRRQGTRLLRELATISTPIIVLEPGFKALFSDEYRTLGIPVPVVEDVSHFLASRLDRLPSVNTAEHAPLLYFPHCMERLGDTATAAQWETIFSHLGFSITTASIGCCGMAGIFGHESANKALSHTIFESDWNIALSKSGQAIATGFSCRHQVKRFQTSRPPHPIEIIGNAL